jgi:hypothetical protein
MRRAMTSIDFLIRARNDQAWTDLLDEATRHSSRRHGLMRMGDDDGGGGGDWGGGGGDDGGSDKKGADDDDDDDDKKDGGKKKSKPKPQGFVGGLFQGILRDMIGRVIGLAIAAVLILSCCCCVGFSSFFNKDTSKDVKDKVAQDKADDKAADKDKPPAKDKDAGPDGEVGPPIETFAKGKVLLNVTSKLTKKDKNDPEAGKSRMKVFKVDLEAKSTYVISMNSMEFDAYLKLEDSTNDIVAEDDDSGAGLNARIVYTVPKSGTYKVIATTFRENEFGSFQLTVQEVGDAKVEGPKKDTPKKDTPRKDKKK